jgi:hypothetical protein
LQHGFAAPQGLLSAIVGMYCSLEYAVQYGGVHCPSFPVGVGVKQGCPLSPVLYALYVCGLRAWLQQHCPDVGYHGDALPQPMREIFYADDLSLVAERHDGAQQLVTATAAFMGPQRCQVFSVAKSLYMVFGPEAPTLLLPALMLEGQPVPRAVEARLLGLIFDSAATPGRMLAHRADVYAAQFGVVTAGLRLSRAHRAHSVRDAVHLTRVVAESAGLYGCGLWGVPHCKPTLPQFYALADPLEQRRCRLLRGLLRLPKDTPHLCLLHELGLRPLVHTYVLSAVKLYNGLLAGGPLFSALLRENVADALARAPAVRNWVYHLHQALQFVHPRGQWRQRLLTESPQALPFGAVRKALAERYNDHVAALKQRQPGQRGSWVGWYFRDVCTHALGAQPVYLRRRLPYLVQLDCMRFRLGVHSLQVRLGRHARPLVPRRRRYCLRCQPRRCLDDECHCMFHCGHPQLVAARAALQPVVQGQVCRTVADVFRAAGGSTGHIRRVARFLATCQRVSLATRGGVQAAPAVAAAAGGHDSDSDWADLDLAGSLSGSDVAVAFDDFSSSGEDGSELVEVMLPPGVVLPDDLYV